MKPSVPDTIETRDNGEMVYTRRVESKKLRQHKHSWYHATEGWRKLQEQALWNSLVTAVHDRHTPEGLFRDMTPDMTPLLADNGPRPV